MKANLKFILTAAASLLFAPLFAQNEAEGAEATTIDVEPETEVVEETVVAYEESDADFTVKTKADIANDNDRFWKGNNKLFSLGFATGAFDLGKYNGGKLESRWGASLKGGRNIYLHKKPIAHALKFGLFIGADVTYLNFKKGHGGLGDLTSGFGSDDDDYYDDYEPEFNLGSHYLTAGIAIGPTATVMPFFWAKNPNLARIKVRPYFQVVPSYSALIVSPEDDDTELHSAFTCMFAGGFELIWRKLSIGFEWKGGRARYKDLISDIVDDYMPETGAWVGADTRGKQPRYGCRMFTISIGVEW